MLPIKIKDMGFEILASVGLPGVIFQNNIGYKVIKEPEIYCCSK